MSSSSGLDSAASTARLARSSPTALPMPIIAMPRAPMTVRTSAKSRLISPGRVIRSLMPSTAFCSTSLAALKAFIRLTEPPSTSLSFSFGITISESTCCCSWVMPCMACAMRFLPSLGKGFVTTATVRIFISFATSAITGAAPVPVPPPMPLVMNSRSVPSSISAMRSRSSSAAWRPISGLLPAPRPRVISVPSCSCWLGTHFSRWSRSVLAQMNSTPPMPDWAIWLTVLQPPPPTPMTRITAVVRSPSTSSNVSCIAPAINASLSCPAFMTANAPSP